MFIPANTIYVENKIHDFVNEGNFIEAKKIMNEYDHDEQWFIISSTLRKPTDNIIKFMNSFEKPKWEYYVSSLSIENGLKFLELAQKNNINLFGKINNNNKQNKYQLNLDMSSLGLCKNDVFKVITKETIEQAFIDNQSFNTIKKWLRSYVFITPEKPTKNKNLNYMYEKNKMLAHTLFEKLNTPEIAKSKNYKKLFTLNNFTQQLLDLNENDFNDLTDKYVYLFSNKEYLENVRKGQIPIEYNDIKETIKKINIKI